MNARQPTVTCRALALALVASAGACVPSARPVQSESIATVMIPAEPPATQPMQPSAASSASTPALDSQSPLIRPQDADALAIQSYSSDVAPDSVSVLNTARAPFAVYLGAIHNRVHPRFADVFLASLDKLPSNHPLNDQGLVVNLEIVLQGDTGQLTKVGVLRPSGVTAFDVAALDAVIRGAPYGKAPEAIRSADGKVYVRWEFRRNLMHCSTANARPLILGP